MRLLAVWCAGGIRVGNRVDIGKRCRIVGSLETVVIIALYSVETRNYIGRDRNIMQSYNTENCRGSRTGCRAVWIFTEGNPSIGCPNRNGRMILAIGTERQVNGKSRCRQGSQRTQNNASGQCAGKMFYVHKIYTLVYHVE